MRIDPQNPVPANTSTSRVNEARTGTARNTSASSSNEPNDTVQLSSGHAVVRQLVSKLDQVPETRQEQVSTLRAEVQSGQFNRSNEQVAGAIVDQLFGRNATG